MARTSQRRLFDWFTSWAGTDAEGMYPLDDGIKPVAIIGGEDAWLTLPKRGTHLWTVQLPPAVAARFATLQVVSPRQGMFLRIFSRTFPNALMGMSAVGANRVASADQAQIVPIYYSDGGGSNSSQLTPVQAGLQDGVTSFWEIGTAAAPVIVGHDNGVTFNGVISRFNEEPLYLPPRHSLAVVSTVAATSGFLELQCYVPGRLDPPATYSDG